MTAGVEVADEAAEAVLEPDGPTVRPPVVDDQDAEIGEGALEHAAAAVPRTAGARELVERVGALLDADPVHSAEHLVERARRTRAPSRSGVGGYRHGLPVYDDRRTRTRTMAGSYLAVTALIVALQLT